jgi:hypothetical protein
MFPDAVVDGVTARFPVVRVLNMWSVLSSCRVWLLGRTDMLRGTSRGVVRMVRGIRVS